MRVVRKGHAWSLRLDEWLRVQLPVPLSDPFQIYDIQSHLWIPADQERDIFVKDGSSIYIRSTNVKSTPKFDSIRQRMHEPVAEVPYEGTIEYYFKPRRLTDKIAPQSGAADDAASS